MRKSTIAAVVTTIVRDIWRATAGGVPRHFSAQPPGRNTQRVRRIVKPARAAKASTDADRMETLRGHGAWRAA